MQEIFTRILKYIPAFLSDLVGLLSAPNTFLVTRARRADEGLSDSLTFLGIATALSVLLASSMIGSDSLVQRLILLCVAGVIMLSMFVVVVILAWRFVGGTGTTNQHVVIYSYQSGPLVLIIPLVMILFWPAAVPDEQEYMAILRERLAIATLILSPIALVWTLLTWGAYRVVNNVSRARSVAAFVLALVLSIPANLLSRYLGEALGSR